MVLGPGFVRVSPQCRHLEMGKGGTGALAKKSEIARERKEF